MASLYTVILIVHLVGLSLGVGSATVKNILLLKCNSNYEFITTYGQVVRTLTKTIIAGLILLTVTGISWFFLGYTLHTYIIIKMVLVLSIWVLGPIIDNIYEPRFFKAAPVEGASPTRNFIRAKNQYMTVDFLATAIFYVIIIMWVLR